MSKTFLDADMDAEIEEMEKENEGKYKTILVLENWIVTSTNLPNT